MSSQMFQDYELIQTHVEQTFSLLGFKTSCFKSTIEVYEKPLIDSNGERVYDDTIIIKHQHPLKPEICNYYIIHKYIYPIMSYKAVLQHLESNLTLEEVSYENPEFELVLKDIRECGPPRTNPTSIRMFELVWETPLIGIST